MHLLQYNNDGDLSLTEFDESDSPEYAILSHTWEQDNSKEVTYAEVISGTGHDKEGFKKIKFCGEQARQDGLSYFWVDTCCINKQNKAELRHSINSMFRWYRNASRCYVYLSDVSTRNRRASDLLSEQTWELSFRDSRWFTRGWTLQELLAPASVEFFTFEGKRLGDKSSLQTQICKATNISPAALQGESLSHFHIDERMRWIEHRETGQEEDKAYSLLGIFGVSMVPTYGEGVAKAFDRLWDKFRAIEKCKQDLRLTDPRLDKERIEATKGGLIKETYQWVMKTSDFQQWRNSRHKRLLWIKGDPGKGKTMLLCGIANELQSSLAKSALLSYFFCQATDSRINSATAVLRGLIYLLVDQQPSLASHVQTSYDKAGKTLFEDINAWVALSEIFVNILQDPSLKSTYLMIDALDECERNLYQLLDLINRTASISSRVKWIVSSRNQPDIESRLRLDNVQMRLSLELNEEHVSRAVELFINLKVPQLPLIADNSALQETVRGQIFDKASGTFLWAALVLKELESVESWDVLDVLQEMPLELGPLYDRMLRQVEQLQRKDLKFCRRVLSTITLAYRPLHLLEVGALSDLPEQISTNPDSVMKVINKCGSFLTVRANRAYFIHQSVKDFLLEKALDRVFPSGMAKVNYMMFLRSREVMSRTLHCDMYGLCAPGYPIEEVEPPVPDPLASVQYSCVYWIDHLLECDKRHTANELKDGGPVYEFLRASYVYWLEALSLLKRLPDGIVMIAKLENLLKADECHDLHAFVHDARRFVVYNRSVIEKAPLQSYCSALIFSPEKSLVRMAFEKYIPDWILQKPKVPAYWNALLQTLEGHSSHVYSVAFSRDGKQVVSGSDDKTVRLWDVVTGAALQTLEGHSDFITSVAFSPDGKQVVSGSHDKTVRLWDAVTGAALQTLEGHSDSINSVAFSPDGKQVVSGSHDKTVRLWDVVTRAALQTLKGHSDSINSVAFSPDGKQVVSGSWDQTVRLWDAVTGAALQTLEGHSDSITSVAFSPDGKQVVSGSWDQTVRLWDAVTGAALQTLEGHSDSITSVAFSPDGKQVVSGSWDQTVRLWDAVTGAALQTLEGHSSFVSSVAFSPDGKQVVSGSYDKTVRLWDAVTRAALQTLEGHSNSVTSVAFSPDGKQVVSGSWDQTVRLWDAVTGAALQTLEGHSSFVSSVAFSPDGKQVVSGSHDTTVRLWDAVTGAALQTLKGHLFSVTSVAFSPDGKQVVSGSHDTTVRLWDTVTGAALQTLEGHLFSVTSVAFSPDGKQVVSGSHDKTVRLWDTVTGAALQTLEGHSYSVSSVAFSPDGKQVVSGSHDKTVRLWDVVTGAALQTLKGHSDSINSVAFSPDGRLLPSLNISNLWVVEGAANILWLPPDYRATSIAIWKENITWAQSSGRISFIRFRQGPKFVY